MKTKLFVTSEDNLFVTPDPEGLSPPKEQPYKACVKRRILERAKSSITQTELRNLKGWMREERFAGDKWQAGSLLDCPRFRVTFYEELTLKALTPLACRGEYLILRGEERVRTFRYSNNPE